MGQRLNIEIVNGETSLANCYYHWSAYTHSALCLTKKIIDVVISGVLENTKDAIIEYMAFKSKRGGANNE